MVGRVGLPWMSDLRGPRGRGPNFGRSEAKDYHLYCEQGWPCGDTLVPRCPLAPGRPSKRAVEGPVGPCSTLVQDLVTRNFVPEAGRHLSSVVSRSIGRSVSRSVGRSSVGRSVLVGGRRSLSVAPFGRRRLRLSACPSAHNGDDFRRRAGRCSGSMRDDGRACQAPPWPSKPSATRIVTNLAHARRM